jgi:hypothetical protein
MDPTDGISIGATRTGRPEGAPCRLRDRDQQLVRAHTTDPIMAECGPSVLLRINPRCERPPWGGSSDDGMRDAPTI